MEAGFHAVLPETWVAHTHSVAGMLLGMLPTVTARALATRATGSDEEIGWVPPSLPGYGLTAAMTSMANFHRKNHRLWVQKNHGLAWTGKSAGDIENRSWKLESVMRRHFEFQKFPFPHAAGSGACRGRASGRSVKGKHGQFCKEICFCRWPVLRFDLAPLFPDFVIYFNLVRGAPKDLYRLSDTLVHLCSSSAPNRQDKEEVFYAHALLHTLAAQNHCLQPLPRTMIRVLKTLETEKHRLRQVNCE